MRLWSIHPEYLDRMGFLGLWREALHAQKVLMGQTRGYVNHPQLDRFKRSGQPVPYIVEYLKWIYRESLYRDYKFNAKLITQADNVIKPITVSLGQLNYEYDLLLLKVKARDEQWYASEMDILRPDEIVPHPLFVVDYNNQKPEPWEKIKSLASRLTT